MKNVQKILVLSLIAASLAACGGGGGGVDSGSSTTSGGSASVVSDPAASGSSSSTSSGISSSSGTSSTGSGASGSSANSTSSGSTSTNTGTSIPSSPTAALTASSEQAKSLLTAVVGGAGQLRDAAQTRSDLGSLSSLGVPGVPSLPALGASQTSLKSLGGVLALAPKAATTVNCAQLANLPTVPGVPSFTCTGTLTVDTNITTSLVGTIPAGTFVDINYGNVSMTIAGYGNVALNGGLRVNYVTDFTANPANGTIQYVATNLTASMLGSASEAQNGTANLVFTNGALSIDDNGMRATGVVATVTDDDNYRLTDGTLRTPYNSLGYLDCSYSNWLVTNGVPAANASVTVTGTSGSAASVTITSSSATQVVARVSFAINGVTTAYTVTATLGANGTITSTSAVAA